MILFKRIAYRNFLSSGNNLTEINLTGETTTLIIGHNGSGKSTMLDALCFSLFNKAFRKINKNQLVNSTNEKECLVEVEFSIGNKEYKIIRGIKPNIFEIWINGELQNQVSASIDQQKHLEDIILKLNYKSFTQIVILGSASFVPFMQLSTANRREVVEDLLDIKIFSAMNSILKEKIRSSNEKIKEFDIFEKSIQEKILMQTEFIEELEKRGNDKIIVNQEKIVNLLNEVGVYIRQNSFLEEDVFKYTTVGVFATVGKSKVKVAKQPKVMIVSTGNELVEVTETPAEHQIRRSNAYTLVSLLERLHIKAETSHILDDKQVLKSKINKFLSEYDVLIFSGAVSKGKFDFIPEVLNELGVEKLFHK